MNQKGFANIALIVLFLLVLLGGVGYVLLTRTQKLETEQPAPEERTAERTRPITTQPEPKGPTQTTAPTPTIPRTHPPLQTEGVSWKTYTNSEHGFAFKYPQNVFLESANTSPRWNGTLRWDDNSMELVMFAKGGFPRTNQGACGYFDVSRKTISSGRVVEIIERGDCSDDTGTRRVSSMSALIPLENNWELHLGIGDSQKTLSEPTRDWMSMILSTFTFSSAATAITPTINSINPTASAANGSTITIIGADFNPQSIIICFSGSGSANIPCPIELPVLAQVSSDGTRATFPLPTGISPGTYKVKVGTAMPATRYSNAVDFQILPN